MLLVGLAPFAERAQHSQRELQMPRTIPLLFRLPLPLCRRFRCKCLSWSFLFLAMGRHLAGLPIRKMPWMGT